MIDKLRIKNFKSIKDLELDCKKINVFIGEPNSGKSNILETLSLLSWLGHMNTELKECVRFEKIHNLFCDNNTEQPIKIITTSEEKKLELKMEFNIEDELFRIFVQRNKYVSMNYKGSVEEQKVDMTKYVKLYKFIQQETFPKHGLSFLNSPYGTNLFSILMSRKEIRRTVANFFREFGFRLVLMPDENKLAIQKHDDDIDDDIDNCIVVQFPYSLTSDTLQRIIFYYVAIKSNQNSTILLEEPDANAFPYYIKLLGEIIAFDESNQYFIVTHNPYLLLPILEKAPANSVNVFITYFRDYQTKVKCLSDDEIAELVVFDPILNIDAFIDEEE